MSGLIQDITERKTNALELAHRRAHLEELVALGTQGLDAAREQAEQANRAKSDALRNGLAELVLALGDGASASELPQTGVAPAG